MCRLRQVALSGLRRSRSSGALRKMFSPRSANRGNIPMAGCTVTNRRDDRKTHLHEAVPRRSPGTLQRKPEAGRPVRARPPCLSPAARAVRMGTWADFPAAGGTCSPPSPLPINLSSRAALTRRPFSFRTVILRRQLALRQSTGLRPRASRLDGAAPIHSCVPESRSGKTTKLKL